MAQLFLAVSSEDSRLKRAAGAVGSHRIRLLG